jgi:hypothetical protein
LKFGYDNVSAWQRGLEIYRNRVPAKFIGESFDIFAKALLDLKRENIDIIPIRICRDGKVYLKSKDRCYR